ncbi:MAG: heme o synthase [Verrucomicrobiota bacterium JB023]|nr:heme o synthase [Verrucomicrobiota bacterium JB023]
MANSLSKDLQTLVKARLNTFVLVTTFFGYAIACRNGGWDWWTLVHLLIGTAACAFGSAVFNQLSEVESDALMKRTADRPLPSKRVKVEPAFILGWVLAAFGIVHLGITVGKTPAWIGAATIAIYVFIYTPMKKWSSLNTLVGAIPGALPPLMGWTAGGGGLAEAGGWYLFALLFLWQLPHFVAINWLCREEYEVAGYKMWSDGDESGKRSVSLAVAFSVGLALLALAAPLMGLAGWPYAVIGVLMAAWLVAKGMKFLKSGERQEFRRFFLLTLLYLPITLAALLIFWR